MFRFLRKFLSPSIVPDVGLTPREIDINIPPQSQAALRRHASRLSRVLLMRPTRDIELEIKSRQAALMSAGFKRPNTVDDAKQILNELEVAHGYHV